MSRSLDDLDPAFKPLAIELIARLIEQGIMHMIIDTLRTPEEQAENLAKGVSWTLKSKHLAQPPLGKSKAIDLCPFLQYDLYSTDKLQWDAKDPVWQKMGTVAKKISGIKWGVWLANSAGFLVNVDPGHFQ